MNTGIKININILNGCDVSYSTESKGVHIICEDNLNLYFNLENFDPTNDSIDLRVTPLNRSTLNKIIPFNEIQIIIDCLLSNSEELRELLPWLRFLDEEFKLKMLKCFKFCNKLIEDLSTHMQMYPNFDILLIEDPQITTQSIEIMYNSFF